MAVFGAGTTGLIPIQVAKASGAKRVFIIGRRQQRLETAKLLGADSIVDIDQEDYFEKILDLTDGVGVETVLDATGSPEGLNKHLK